ncbi:fungal-specific transcription factor domain protein [Aspergillus avenaceus]|uniref:Fungal-specific transcription factor domain protein n=1 Tax=Aspergillus avenaceus TaxID=36643 RepID=A0A5N6TZT0_ASPAV|nr:fungal-specific transcription factor domain protein [Aspergillus avenaceus]
MFSTFMAISDGNTTNRTSNDFPAQTTTPVSTHSKRHQVARACHWCRVHRIKCDSNVPCRNCRRRGSQCTKRKAAEIRTLPQAVREIGRLQDRIRELEAQPQNATTTVSHTEHPTIRPPQGAGAKTEWDGIHTRTAYSSQTQWYGPSSAFYFIGRMSAYLSAVLKHPQDDHHLQPNSASRTFTSPTVTKHVPEGLPAPSMSGEEPMGPEKYLCSFEEDFFLDLFWQSYHPTYQILNEGKFREHYRSLWVHSGATRRSSALVDIVLALCMQYGVALTPTSKDSTTPERSDGQIDLSDASIAGRWYYRRSQMLLLAELESPSITTLQCHIFSVVYLCNASFQNMAHTTLALAIRTAHVLGLHLEPPESLPRPEREWRKRIWWTLYTVESKTCMKLGRPSFVPDWTATCQLPADDPELARQSGSAIAADGDQVTWLTYSRLVAGLVLAVQTVYNRLNLQRTELLAVNGLQTLSTPSSSLEALATLLQSQMVLIRDWFHNVPDAMKAKRTDGGEPFSTDRPELALERYAPSWLQRQRLLLELLYHNLLMNLHRPFICFPSSSTISKDRTPLAAAHATSCVRHAITITRILHQVVPATDFLTGWYEAFQWQWNSTLSLVGFVLADPCHPDTPPARAAIDHAITVLEVFGNHFAVARSAAQVARGLSVKADFLRAQFSAEVGPGTLGTPSISDLMEGVSTPLDSGPAGAILVDEPPAMFQSTLAGAMGLSSDLDSFFSFEPLYAGSNNLADAWNLSHY